MWLASFNPRARKERDGAELKVILAVISFNPRARKERDYL